MRCYDAIIKEMEDAASDEGYNKAEADNFKVQFLQEKLQTAVRENWELTQLAKQRTEQLDKTLEQSKKDMGELAELKEQLKDDLDFQNESVVMSIRRSGNPCNPTTRYTLNLTTAKGTVKVRMRGQQFQTLAELCRLQKIISNLEQDGVINYRDVSISESDIGSEVTLHT